MKSRKDNMVYCKDDGQNGGNNQGNQDGSNTQSSLVTYCTEGASPINVNKPNGGKNR